MKATLILAICLVIGLCASAQTSRLRVTNGAVTITNAELVLMNGSQNTNGYLYNTGSGTTTFTDAKTARRNLGLESVTALSTTTWASLTISSTDRFVLNLANGGSQGVVTYTLPLASSVNAGAVIVVGDGSGFQTTNGIVVAKASGSNDLINGVSVTPAFTAAYFQVKFISDGVSNWYYAAPTSAAATVVSASASQAGIINLTNQTLGAGIKTVQGLETTTTINLPATTGSATGVINFNGSAFIHAFGGNTNIFAGNNSGNFTLTAGSAFYSTGFGSSTLSHVTTGSQNAAFGGAAGNSVTSGWQNTFLGGSAGSSTTTGYDNTFVGFGAGVNNIDGVNNTFIGWQAGINSTGGSNSSAPSDNIMIGYRSGSTSAYNGSNNVFIGNYGYNSGSGVIPNNKLCISGGSGHSSLIYGDFNTGQLQINPGSFPVLTPSAAFEIVSTSGGFLMPRMSQSQFTSLPNKAQGVMVYEPTLAQFLYYDGTTTRSVGANASSSNTPQALSDAASIVWNVGNGSNASVTLGGNRTLSISNATAGMYGTLVVNQDATGSRTLTLPAGSKVSSNWGSGTTIYLSTVGLATDVLSFYFDGTNYFWTIGKNFQ